MKAPFALYKRCEKDGRASRCAMYPACACDWYDRPRRPDGRRPWVHLPNTATSKTLAYSLAQKKRQDETLYTEGLKTRPKPAAPLLSVYIETYKTSSEELQRKDPKKRDANLAHFLATVKDRPIDQVTDEMIDRWRVGLLARPRKRRLGEETPGTWNRNTVQRCYNSVKGLFRSAAKQLKVPNPCDALTDWSEDPAARILWHPNQLWLIDELPDLYRLPLKVGLFCGCRRTEALELTKHDLSPKGFVFKGSAPKLGWIAIQRKKKTIGMVKMRVPIALTLVNELRKQLKSPFQVRIFGDDPVVNPGAWSSNLRRKLRALGNAYGIDTRGLCMHGTRHTATTAMQDLPGVSAKTAQAMGGWTTTRMVETYSHPAEASMQLAAAGLAQRWQPRRPKGLKARGTTGGTTVVPRAPRSASLRLVAGDEAGSRKP